MLRLLTFGSVALLVAAPASAAVQPFPPGFRTQMIDTNGTKYYVRVGGTGCFVREMTISVPHD